MANRVATILGVVFLLVGVLGFVMPDAARRASLPSPQHHSSRQRRGLVVARSEGHAGSREDLLHQSSARSTCSSASWASSRGEGADRMLAVIPGQLELGTWTT